MGITRRDYSDVPELEDPSLIGKGDGRISAFQIEEVLFGETLAIMVWRFEYMRRLERAWDLITSDYRNSDLTLAYAARAIGVSKNHLNVLLRGATTLTFHQLLTRYRVLMSVLMIKSKNHSILEIALENGFGSLNSFERNFRVLLGVTPVEFKKSCHRSRHSEVVSSAERHFS